MRGRRAGLGLGLAAQLSLLGSVVTAGHFKDDEEVPLYANKVGPYVNPSETYAYYDLPFCQTHGMEAPAHSLGERLKGDSLTKSLFEIKFKKNVERAKLCGVSLTPAQEEQLKQAILKDYYFEMIIDKLPMWGFVGESRTGRALVHKGGNTTGTAAGGGGKAGEGEPSGHKGLFLFTHLHFHFGYNGDQIVEASVSTDAELEADLDVHKEVTFTYSVTWAKSDTVYAARMERYAKAAFLPMHLEIHWFSILNSVVTVLLLTGFLATILMRVLKNDFVKYERDLEEDNDEEEETGWKLIHGDVFRIPPHIGLLCSFVGVGAQLGTLMVALFVLGVAGVFYPHSRGSTQVAIVVLYAVTAGISGYTSSLLFRKFNGKNWVRNVLQTATLFAFPFFVVFCFENSIAIMYDTTVSLPLGTIMLILAIWGLVTFPLTVLGGITGKNAATEFEAPCRTKKIPSAIPPLPWFRQGPVQVLMAGFLPFSAIYIEIYYIFASVWGHKIYSAYSILFIVFLILLIVTSFISITLTYFQLAVEDHKWWWRSFMNGGSTGLFIYVYCFFYYHYRSEMVGFLQACFFFGYMAVICYAFFITLGAVGFLSSLGFVQYIYRTIKCD